MFRRKESRSSKTSMNIISPADALLSSSNSIISASVLTALPISTVQDKQRLVGEGLEIDNAVIQGWLDVRQGCGLIWKRRYCMIIGSFLYVSKSREVQCLVFTAC